jgi:hypothetical protein
MLGGLDIQVAQSLIGVMSDTRLPHPTLTMTSSGPRDEESSGHTDDHA